MEYSLAKLSWLNLAGSKMAGSMMRNITGGGGVAQAHRTIGYCLNASCSPGKFDPDKHEHSFGGV